MTDPTSEPVEPAADDPSGPETAPEDAAEASEDTTVDEETRRVFADAFGPGDDGGFTPDEYEALAAEYDTDAYEEIPYEEIPGGNAEAARYRHRLRDAKNELAATQDQLDALQERVDTLHRAEAERLAAGSLVEPGDLWRDGATVADIRNPHGDVDDNAVRKLAAAVIDAHPHAARASRSVWGRPGSGASPPPSGEVSPAWAQAFAPHREG